MRVYVPLVVALALAGCVPANLPAGLPSLTGLQNKIFAQPAMRWDHRPEAAEWTSRSLAAIAHHDSVLAAQVPSDIATWCPGYPKAALPERRAFWAGLLSAVAKYESSWNPNAAGGGGRYIGVMQISPKTAGNYGCKAQSSAALKDGGANLECAVEILAHQIAKDGQVAGNGERGAGRDWHPLRAPEKRAAMSAWTSSQSYCQ